MSTTPVDIQSTPSQQAACSFEELALPHFPSLYSFARSLARSDADAEDLVQETYLKALRGFASFEPGTNFRAWMFRILKNAFLNSKNCAQYRHAADVDPEKLIAQLPSRFTDSLDWVMERAWEEKVQSAIHRLPSHLNQVLVMCCVEESTYREAAETLSIPIGTVMSRVARARETVRRTMHGSVGANKARRA